MCFKQSLGFQAIRITDRNVSLERKKRIAWKEFIISQATRVVAEDFRNNILKNATEILQRDIQKVTTQKESDNEIYLTVDDHAAVEGDDFQINQSTDSRITITAKLLSAWCTAP